MAVKRKNAIQTLNGSKVDPPLWIGVNPFCRQQSIPMAIKK